MRGPLRWIVSLIFVVQMYAAMFFMSLYYIPRTVFNRDYAFYGVQAYCRWVRWTAAKMLGLRSEVRGEVPQGEVIIASKHQSFFDIIILVSALPRPKFIMKASLRYAPILGWFAIQIGCVPVERGRRGMAIQKMVADVAAGRQLPGQLVVYPQGTRVAAGARLPYKVGVTILRRETGQDVVPTATNVGVFWPRHGIRRDPGLAVIEFLPPISPASQSGPADDAFLTVLEDQVEGASDALMAEAGFDLPPRVPAAPAKRRFR